MTVHSSFHLFGALPTELRFKIWEQSLEPRYVHISFRECDHDSRFSGRPQYGRPVPVVLQVNKESRECLLQRYPKLFQSKHGSDSNNRDRDGFRFNPDMDFIVMGSFCHDKTGNLNMFMHLATDQYAKDLARIKQMHITPSFSRMMIYAEYKSTLRRQFARFSGLEKITVCESDTIGRTGNVGHLRLRCLTSVVEGLIQGVETSCPSWKSPELEVISDDEWEAVYGNREPPPIMTLPFGLVRSLFWDTRPQT